MSKRSYRRLAVVAGAAFVVGSMAPALAAPNVSVEQNVAANVSGGPQTPPVESVTDFPADIQAIVAGNKIVDAAGAGVATLNGALSGFRAFVQSAPTNAVVVNPEIATDLDDLSVNVDLGGLNRAAIDTFVNGARPAANALLAGGVQAATPLRLEVNTRAGEALGAFGDLRASLQDYVVQSLSDLRNDPTSVVPDALTVDVTAKIVATL